MCPAWAYQQFHLIHSGYFHLFIFSNRLGADSVPDLTAIEDLHLPGSVLHHLGHSADHAFNP